MSKFHRAAGMEICSAAFRVPHEHDSVLVVVQFRQESTRIQNGVSTIYLPLLD